MCGSKQKDVSWMKNCVGMLERERNVVMGFCAGVCSTAKLYLLFVQHRKSVDCDLDSDVWSSAMSNFILEFVLQVLSLYPDSTGDEKVGAVARRLREKVAMVFARRTEAA